MGRLFSYLEKQPKSLLLTTACLLVAWIGILDYETGPEIASSAFYLLPIFLAAWFVDRNSGLAVALVSTAAWLAAELASHPNYSHPAIPYWNASVRLVFFLIVTLVLSALRASEQMRQDLIHFVIHDLRSPLNNILAGLKMVQKPSAPITEKDQKELLEVALVSGTRMLTLVSSILDLSRMESGKMPLRIEDVEIGELVETSVGQVEILATHNKVQIVRRMETGPAAVRADRELASRVLINLVSNALRFSPAESVVTVGVAQSQDGTATFSVSDQGPGIAKEWTGRIFDKFSQVEARKAGEAVGSGLGLTFCRHAVEAQGGRIWLKSDVGKGTTVFFTLPVSPRR